MTTKKQIAIQTQLWGNSNLEQNFIPIFDDVIRSGYDGVECRFIVMKHKEALHRYLSQNELRIFALHAGFNVFYNKEIVPEFDDLLRDMNEFGINHLLFSPPKKENMEGERELLGVLSEIGMKCAETGIQLSYHNHAWEFERFGYDLFDAVAEYEHIGIALDIGWLYRSGYDLFATLDRYKGEIRYIHMKDTTKEQWKELGTGEVGIAGALPLLENLNLDLWTVEQDNSELLPLASATMSRQFLAKFGI